MTYAVTSPIPQIQTAVYQRLNSDSELRALVTGIFDEVPEGQVHPYVVLGEAFETPDNTHDTFGREVVITLHTWSRYRGYAEVLRITDRIITLLDHQPLSITGHNVIAVRHEFAQTLRDPDPEIRHVPIRFRVVTEQDTT